MFFAILWLQLWSFNGHQLAFFPLTGLAGFRLFGEPMEDNVNALPLSSQEQQRGNNMRLKKGSQSKRDP